MHNGSNQHSFEERDYLWVSEQEVKALALKYKLLPGQIRGMIARIGMDAKKLAAEADRLRHR